MNGRSQTQGGSSDTSRKLGNRSNDSSPNTALSEFIREMKLSQSSYKIVVDNPRRVQHPTTTAGKSSRIYHNTSDKRASRWLADAGDHPSVDAIVEDKDNGASSKKKSSSRRPEPSSRHISRSHSDQSTLPRLPKRQISDTSLDSPKTLASKEKYKNNLLSNGVSFDTNMKFLPLPMRRRSSSADGNTIHESTPSLDNEMFDMADA